MSQLTFGSVVTLRVDAFQATAPYESDRWASTDRGWLYDVEHPARNGRENLPVGNYLDYGPCGAHHRERPEGSVHAMFTPWENDPITGAHRQFPCSAAYVHTPEAAQLWIEQQHRAWCAGRQS